jgi:hypothetical protein
VRAPGRPTRELLDRLALRTLGQGRDCDDALFRDAEIDPTASLNEVEVGDEVAVEVEGDRATVREPGEPALVALREGGDWKMHPLATPAYGYALRAADECGAIRAAELRQPLPSPSRQAVARALRRDARTSATLRERLGRLEPPARRAADHRRVLAELDRQRKAFERAGDGIAGVAPITASVQRAGRTVERSTTRLMVAQRRLGFGCAGPQTGEVTASYRRDAERACTRAARRIRRIDDEPRGAAAAARYLRRLEAAGTGAVRALRRLDPPDVVADRHRDTVAAYEDVVETLATERRTIARGPRPVEARRAPRAARGPRGRRLPPPGAARLRGDLTAPQRTERPSTRSHRSWLVDVRGAFRPGRARRRAPGPRAAGARPGRTRRGGGRRRRRSPRGATGSAASAASASAELDVVAGGDQDAGLAVADDLRQAAVPRGDHDAARGARLERRVGQRVGLRGRDGDDIGRAEHVSRSSRNRQAHAGATPRRRELAQLAHTALLAAPGRAGDQPDGAGRCQRTARRARHETPLALPLRDAPRKAT